MERRATQVLSDLLLPLICLKKLFNEPGAGNDEMPAAGYGVLIENISEQQQLELLERLTAEGFTVKAMTF